MDLLGLLNAMKELCITYGNSGDRKHIIWTYVGGATQDRVTNYDCPCNTGSSIQAPPPFVGNDFYCESASNSGALFDKLYNTDPL